MRQVLLVETAESFQDYKLSHNGTSPAVATRYMDSHLLAVSLRSLWQHAVIQNHACHTYCDFGRERL